MASTHEGSNDMRKTVKKEPRRSWTPEEDDVLLKALKELVVKGWKSDNGFRANYLNRLEDDMRKVFPQTNIKASPHINSKITSWKKKYAQIVTILNMSGVGFNLHGDNKIDCDPEQWEAIIKIDSTAEKLRGRPLLKFESWKQVFGKDRATGEGAEDVMESVNGLIAEHGVADVDPTKKADTIDVDEIQKNEVADESVYQSAGSDVKTSKKTKKRTLEDNIQNLTVMLNEQQKDTNARLKSLVERIGYQVDLCRARKDVFALLQIIPDLSIDNQFEACEILVDKPSFLEFFMGLPQSAQPAYVYRILKMKK